MGEDPSWARKEGGQREPPLRLRGARNDCSWKEEAWSRRGGGYTFKAVQADKRFRAVATLSPFNSGEVRREGFRGSQVNSIQERLAAAAKARQAEAAGEPAALTPNMCETATPDEADAMPCDLYREGYYYYGRDCAHPGSTFSYTVSSLIGLAAFDARQGAELIDVPLLMMMDSRADTGYMTIDCYEGAVNARTASSSRSPVPPTSRPTGCRNTSSRPPTTL